MNTILIMIWVGQVGGYTKWAHTIKNIIEYLSFNILKDIFCFNFLNMTKFQGSGLKIVEVQLLSHPKCQYQNLILQANKSVIYITLYCSIVTITKSNLKQI